MLKVRSSRGLKQEIRICLNATRDVTLERNVLYEKVFSSFEKKCIENNISFQVLDLHPAVELKDLRPRDYYANLEVAFHQMSECQGENIHGAFLYIFGEHDGPKMLPTEIESQTFQIIKSYLEPPQADEIQKLYCKDKNLLPEAYVLDFERDYLSQMSYGDLWTKLESASPLLEMAFKTAHAQGMVPQEALNYLFNSDIQLEYLVCLDTLPKQRRLCFRRTISAALDSNDQNANDAVSLAVSVRDIFLEKILEIDPESLHDVRLTGSEVNTVASEHTDYIEQLCMKVKDMLEALFKEVQHKSQTQAIAGGEDVPLEYSRPSTRHLCVKKVYPQEEAFYSIKTKLFSSAKVQKPLLIYGPSGSGKTSVLHTMAESMEDWFDDQYKLIYIDFKQGNVKGCIADVLCNICRKMVRHVKNCSMDIPDSHHVHTIAGVFAKLCSGSLKTNVFIIIDNLDDMPDIHNAQSLQWLPRSLSSKVKIVLSVCNDSQAGKHLVDVCSVLLNDPSRIYKLDAFAKISASEMVLQTLKGHGKALTTCQLEAIFSAFSSCQTPLYVEIAVTLARHMRSYHADVAHVFENMNKLVNELFDKLEAAIGKEFVSISLGFITAAKYGITENELKELMKRAVLNSSEGGYPVEYQLQRLVLHLQSVLSLCDVQATTCLVWANNVMKMSASKRYLGKSKSIHAQLAEFFKIKFSGKQVTLNYDERLLSGLVYHLAKSKKLDELEEILTSVEWWRVKLGKSHHCAIAKELKCIASKDLAQLQHVCSLIEGLPYHLFEYQIEYMKCGLAKECAGNILLSRMVTNFTDFLENLDCPVIYELQSHKQDYSKPDYIDVNSKNCTNVTNGGHLLIGEGNSILHYQVTSSGNLILQKERSVGPGITVQNIIISDHRYFMAICNLSSNELIKNTNNRTNIIKVLDILSWETIYSGDGVFGFLSNHSKWFGVVYTERIVIFEEKKRLSTLTFPNKDHHPADVSVHSDDSTIVVKFKNLIYSAYDLKGNQVWSSDINKVSLTKQFHLKSSKTRSKVYLPRLKSSKSKNPDNEYAERKNGTKQNMTRNGHIDDSSNVTDQNEIHHWNNGEQCLIEGDADHQNSKCHSEMNGVGRDASILKQETCSNGTDNERNGISKIANGHKALDTLNNNHVPTVTNENENKGQCSQNGLSHDISSNDNNKSMPAVSRQSLKKAVMHMGISKSFVISLSNLSTGQYINMFNITSGKHLQHELLLPKDISKLICSVCTDSVVVCGKKGGTPITCVVAPPTLKTRLELPYHVRCAALMDSHNLAIFIHLTRLEIWGLDKRIHLLTLPCSDLVNQVTPIRTAESLLLFSNDRIESYKTVFDIKDESQGPHLTSVVQTKFSSGMDKLVVGDISGTVAIFETLTSTLLGSIRCHTSEVSTLSIFEDTIISSCKTEITILRMASNLELLARISLEFEPLVCAYQKDFRRIIVLGNTEMSIVSLLGKVIVKPQSIESHSSVVFSNNVSYLILVSSDRASVKIWDSIFIEDGLGEGLEIDMTQCANVEHCIFNPDETLFYLLTSGDDAINLHSSKNGSCIASCKTSGLQKMALSRCSKYLGAWNGDTGIVEVYKLSNTDIKVLHKFSGLKVTNMTFFESGRILVSYFSDNAVKLVIYDHHTGNEIYNYLYGVNFPIVNLGIVKDYRLMLVPRYCGHSYKPIMLQSNSRLQNILNSENSVSVIDLVEKEEDHNDKRGHKGKKAEAKKSSRLCVVL